MTSDKNNLLYRRQFILGPRYIKRSNQWKRRRIAQNLFLSVHPDLELNYVSKKHISLILLGFILDPYNTEYSNKDILNRLVEENDTFEEVVRATYSLGGRWIIIYKDNKSLKMFHDAAGDRQIFYSRNNSEIWCASQPHTIAKELGLKKSKDIELNEFIKSDNFYNSENNWPGDGTLYDDVKHLLPNKYLDLKSGICTRYWPDKKLYEISVKKAADRSSKILKGLLECASKRYNLMMAVTSGLDSRVLLAASRQVSDNIFYFVQKFGNLDYKSKDIKIPVKLFAKLNLRFNVIECEEKIDDEFNSIMNKNVSLIQCEEKKVLHYSFFKNFQDKMNVGGNVSEIGRFWYGFDYIPRNVEEFAYLLWGKETFAIKSIEKWVSEVKPIASKFGVNILNLFYWEQRVANWCASFSADLDTAMEHLYPFNCRRLLETLLSVKKKYRTSPNCILYKEIIKKLWPDTLKEPIVLFNIKQVITTFIPSFLKRLHLYTFFSSIYGKIKK